MIHPKYFKKILRPTNSKTSSFSEDLFPNPKQILLKKISPPARLHPLQTATAPFEAMIINFLGLFKPKSIRDSNHIMIITDYLTKRVEAILFSLSENKEKIQPQTAPKDVDQEGKRMHFTELFHCKFHFHLILNFT